MNTLTILLPALLVHAHLGLCLRRLAAQTRTGPAWLAWVPLLNVLLLPPRIAGRSPWWGLLLLAPGVNVLVWALLWCEICDGVGRPRRLALGMLLPGLNLLVLGILARVEWWRSAVALALALLSVPGARSAYARRVHAHVMRQAQILGEPGADRRLQAADELARARPASLAPALPSLAAALRDPDGRVRARAASALARLGPGARDAFAALAEAVKDQDMAVRRSAGQALVSIAGRTGDVGPQEVALQGLLDAARDRGAGPLPEPDLVDALGGFGAAAAPRLVEALKDGSKGVRWHAAGALLQCGQADPGVVPALLEAMKDPEWEVRNAAGLALESLARKDHVPAVVEALRDPNVETRYHAARTLARLGPQATEAIPVLVEALRDEDAEVRMHSARALGRMGAAALGSVPPLIRVLGDSEAEVRASAAWSLGRIGAGSPGVASALRGALQDRDRDVRSAVAYALESVDGH